MTDIELRAVACGYGADRRPADRELRSAPATSTGRRTTCSATASTRTTCPSASTSRTSGEPHQGYEHVHHGALGGPRRPTARGGPPRRALAAPLDESIDDRRSHSQRGGRRPPLAAPARRRARERAGRAAGARRSARPRRRARSVGLRRRRHRGARRAAPARRRASGRTTPTRSRCSASRYQQRARETADASYFARAEAALRRALALAPRDLDALERARHRSRSPSTASATRSRSAAARSALAPATARHLRRRRRRARRARPLRRGLRARSTGWSRSSRASPRTRASRTRASCSGDRAGAIDAMELALDAAGGPRRAGRVGARRARQAPLRPRAARRGRARSYRAALAAFPGYVLALDGARPRRGRARASSRSALALARQAVERVPLPAVRRHARRPATRRAAARREAREQYALVGAIERLLRANGVRTDLETALFDVDHGLRLRPALAAPAARTRERPSIEADDVLGWALVRNGRCARGRCATRSARCGSARATRSSSSTAGWSSAASADRPRRAALVPRARSTLNPHFSLALGTRRQEVCLVRKRLVARSSRSPRSPRRPPRSRTRSATSRPTATRAIEVSGDRDLRRSTSLDLAEIPTFQERAARTARPRGYARALADAAARGLALTVDGEPRRCAELAPRDRVSARRGRARDDAARGSSSTQARLPARTSSPTRPQLRRPPRLA